MTKANYPNDDLFDGSKMSFGEHLEELRDVLWRAVIGLVAGILIGLLFGERVVQFIQTPLKAALERYMLSRAVDDINKKQNVVVSDELTRYIREKAVQPKVISLHRGEVARLLKWSTEKPVPAGWGGAKPAEPPAEEKPAAEKPAAKETTESSPDKKTKPAEPSTIDAVAGKEEKPSSSHGKGTVPAAEARPDPQTGVDPESPFLPDSPDFIKVYTWEPIRVEVSAMNASEAFMIYVQAAIVSGLVLSSAWVLYQIWTFVESGLYPHEKSYVFVFFPMSLGLFIAGAALAFFFVFDPVLDFLFSYNKALEIDPDPRISEWISFVLMLPVGFGVAFQLPLVMLFIERIGIISVETYLAQWRIAVLVIFVVSAVLTPADPISLLLMACPLTFLYFGGVGMCLWMPFGRKPFDEGYEP